MSPGRSDTATSYQRGQIEEAIGKLIEPEATGPSTLLLTRIKRLIDMDRQLVKTGAGYRPAFLSRPLPDRGTNVTFTPFGAFAILTGVRLLQHGWAQRKVVKLMSAVRRDLEREHARMLRLDRETLFDGDAILANARPGDIAYMNADPVVLRVSTVNSQWGMDLEGDVFRVNDTQRAARSLPPPYTQFELVVSALDLHDALSRTSPRPRGRPLAKP